MKVKAIMYIATAVIASVCGSEITSKNLEHIGQDEKWLRKQMEMCNIKNELYKTTIMLKEVADNSKQDKLNLKNSLSDISHQSTNTIGVFLYIY